MATLSIYISRTYVRSGPGGPHNTQTSGRPVKDQRSLKLPRKWLICYLTLSSKIAATAMGKELNTKHRPVKDQRSLKLPRKWLICYLTLSSKIAATAMDKELNTRQDVLLLLLGRIYKTPANWFLLNKNCYTLAFCYH